MSKDDFDPKINAGLELVHELEDRQFGRLYRNANKGRETLGIYAEEELVRKRDYDELRCEMPGSPRSTFLMVFSADGSKVASTHGNHNIYVTDIRSGKNINTLVGHPRTPWCIAFHPTSNQIVASGCLGGQVRIWDLSGGSEMWSAGSSSVIASIAFHPNDRVLVIATFNEIYFWDWSKPEPFVHVATSDPKEKVRYVAFDKVGSKLITGIANSPQTRWDRVRAPVPVPRQAERCASPYRRRITPRLVQSHQPNFSDNNPRESFSGVPERERRIAVCYRNLVREYEQLVQRYLQLYRPPTMIDRGTDPMEPNLTSTTSGTQTPEPSTSGVNWSQTASNSTNENTTTTPEPNNATAEPQSTISHNNLITPSRIFSVIKKPSTLIRGTQTTESRKHKAGDDAQEETQEKRLKREETKKKESSDSCDLPGTSRDVPNCLASPEKVAPSTSAQLSEIGTQTQNPRKVLVINNNKNPPSTTSVATVASHQLSPSTPSATWFRLREKAKKTLMSRLMVNTETTPVSSTTTSTTTGTSTSPGTSRCLPLIRTHVDELLTNISQPMEGGTSPSTSPGPSRSLPSVRSNVEELISNMRRSAGIASAPSSSSGTSTGNDTNVDELLSNIRRTAEEEVRNRILPIIQSVPANDRPELIRLFENSREHVRMRFRQMCPLFLKKNPRSLFRIESSSEGSSSDDSLNRSAPRNSNTTTNQNTNNESSTTTTNTSTSVRPEESETAGNNSNTSTPGCSTNTSSSVRNFNTELEQLVKTLLTEIERNETDRTVTSTSNTQTVNDTVCTTSTNTVSSINTANETSSTSVVETPSDNLAPERENSFLPNNPPTPSFFAEMLETLERHGLRNDNSTTPSAPTTTVETPATLVNTNTRTTNSTIYTSNSVPRRRFFSHRVSAFMPTRVNYTRSPTRLRRNTHALGRTRLGTRFYGNSTFALDELINYSERANSEDDPPAPSQSYMNFHPFDPPPEFPSINPENIGIGNMYSNIVQDLESSLNDVRNIRASNRPGETSDMLSSFSERLENIMNQSDTILSNLRSSMDMLSTTATEPNAPRSQSSTEPTWSFFDQNFYVRDQRTESNEPSTSDTLNLTDLFNSRPPFNPVASDHTYPRNPDSPAAGSSPENMSPLMTSLHLTISHIQRQARLLRQQVESIERIDRAMIEVAQLQLVRQLLIELVRHIRNLTGESRSTGMSSVRQMMAGTRISDSSPYDSPAEEAATTTQTQNPPSNTSTTAEPPSTSGSTTEGNNTANQTRPRGSSRKTYPPSRLFRLQRQSRRPSIVHFLSRRYLNRTERNMRTAGQNRPAANTRVAQELRSQTLCNFSSINASTLSVMTRRLERLLTEPFARHENPPPSSRSSATIDLGEHILALRLHGCVLRMNRVLGNSGETGTIGNLRADPTAAVTQDGVSRISARHTLSLIIDGMSRHMEELGSTNLSPSIRVQIHGVLAMSLLLCELLLLQVVDSIPPPSGMNLDLGRGSLTTRIDQMCGQMLQSRFSGHSQQLTRSLRLMRLTVRHAYRALGQTYIVRRNAMMPRPDTDRRQLLGSINRCLRTINRRRPNSNLYTRPQSSSENQSLPENTDANPTPSTSEANEANDPSMGELYTTLSEFIARYSNTNQEEETGSNPMVSGADSNRDNSQRIENNSSNNSDDNDDEPEWQNTSNEYTHRNRNLYRTNNVNLAPNNDSSSQPRPWNVPSVHINDVPVSEQSLFAHRLHNQRQRFAERMSELRSLPSIGLFRPRFLHPHYANINPFDADLDDPQREQIYDSDMITTVTPNHRIQAWDISDWTVPAISDPTKNVVVSECKIHNDASVDVAKDGTILVTLLPSGGYLNVTNRLGVYSLLKDTLGHCLYTTNFEQSAVSVSLSPLSRHLVVGLASRRVSIVPNDRWIMARIFKIEQKSKVKVDGESEPLPVLKELEQSRDSRINCIRWLPSSGQGLIYATNTGQLVVLS